MIVLFFVVSCGAQTSASTQSPTTNQPTTAETTTVAHYTLPDLSGMDETAALAALADAPVTVNVQYEENETVDNNLFVRYGDDLSAGDSVAEGATITLYFAINYPELPDLTGKSKNDIISELDALGITYTFEYQTNTTIAEDVFVQYGGDDQVGTTISDGHTVTVILATPRLILPDLSGMDQMEIISALLSRNINFVIEVVTDNTVPDQTFAGYADGLEAGDLIPSSYQVTVYLGYNETTLPDLSGKLKTEIASILTENSIQYTFNYVVDDNYPEDSFAGYDGYNVGDYYTEGTIITVNLYKNTFTDNPTSLIISKYVDGGDDTSDQAIEIYNATDAVVDFSNYYLAIYANGSKTVNFHIDLDAIQLLPGETYVVANSNANANILMRTDQMSQDLQFDGNDVIQLCYTNGTYIDTIYNIGNRDFLMDNEVFIRDGNIVKGNRIYQYAQWHGFVPTYVEVLGTFPNTIPTDITFELINRPFDDPLGGMDNVTCTGIADGDTAYFTPGYEGEERVRFLGVDTPETYPYVDPWGPEAKAYTKYILDHAQDVYIESDPDLGYTGTYGRHLGLVWVNVGDPGLTIDILSSTGEVMRTEVLTGWILLNYHLVLNGYSYNYYSSDSSLVMNNRYVFRWFQEAERFATEHNLGVHEA